MFVRAMAGRRRRPVVASLSLSCSLSLLPQDKGALSVPVSGVEGQDLSLSLSPSAPPPLPLCEGEDREGGLLSSTVPGQEGQGEFKNLSL